MKEGDVIVARCLDFTVSSHGDDEKDALKSLAEAVKEYIISAVENDAIDTIFDPAHDRYWRIYNESEAKQAISSLKNFIRKSFKTVSNEKIFQSIADIKYAQAFVAFA
ncbi:MAG TPA: hypothetical protein ENL10_04945 [Candidatus Cloacimonetes bacterium]|nr:hypothetical protein [Candidatus Cloacimonadota bacterium]